MKPVTAWAVVRIVDGREKFDTAFEHKHDAESHMYDVFCPTEVKVVRIVPEAEYKRMRQAERSLMAMDREWEAKLAKKKAVNRGK
jgi:hypothetical protein